MQMHLNMALSVDLPATVVRDVSTDKIERTM